MLQGVRVWAVYRAYQRPHTEAVPGLKLSGFGQTRGRCEALTTYKAGHVDVVGRLTGQNKSGEHCNNAKTGWLVTGRPVTVLKKDNRDQIHVVDWSGCTIFKLYPTKSTRRLIADWVLCPCVDLGQSVA